VAYSKFMGDNLSRFLPDVGLSSDMWIVSLTVFFSLTCVLEDVSVLGRVSSFGIMAGVAFAAIIVFSAGTTGGAHHQDFLQYLSEAPAFNWSGFPVAMGIAVFCNEGMVILSPPVLHAMGSPTWETFRKPLLAMVYVFTLNYLAVAIAGAYLFSPPDSELSLSLVYGKAPY
jgi:amino acid permease